MNKIEQRRLRNYLLFTGVVIGLIGAILFAPSVSFGIQKHYASPSVQATFDASDFKSFIAVTGDGTNQNEIAEIKPILLKAHNPDGTVQSICSGVLRKEGTDQQGINIVGVATIGHCQTNSPGETAIVTIMADGVAEQIEATPIKCEEYNTSDESEDNVALCAYRTQTVPEWVHQNIVTNIAPGYQWESQENVSVTGYPIETNHFENRSALEYSQNGTIYSVGIQHSNGVSEEIACANIFGYGGMSGSPAINDRGDWAGVVAMSCDAGAPIFTSADAAHTGIRALPPDYIQFEDSFWSQVINTAN